VTSARAGATTTSFPQSSTAPGAPPPAFEAASIRLNTANDPMRTVQPLAGGSLRAVNSTDHELIRFAYQVHDYQIVDGPEWTRSARYDVMARGPESAAIGQAAAMLQTLLAERFKLTLRRERRDQSTYELVLARSDGRLGKWLKRSATADCEAHFAAVKRGEATLKIPGPDDIAAPCMMTSGNGPAWRSIQGGTRSLSQLADALSSPLSSLDRVVVDRTGLTGTYDFRLEFSTGVDAVRLNGNEFLPVFTAIQDQLGLKLQPARGSIDVLAIEGVERPSEN